MKSHFCLIKTIDATRPYAPETKIILDVPTALNIFSFSGIPQLIDTVKERINILCNNWNKDYDVESSPENNDKVTSSKRGCLQEIIPIAKYEQPSWNGDSPRVSRLVMILSNFSWVRQHQDTKGPLRCEPRFFTVQVKLSSASFKPYHDANNVDTDVAVNVDYNDTIDHSDSITYSKCSDPDDKYYFDYHGILLSLEDFCSLCELKSFSSDFMSSLENYYTQHSKPKKLHMFCPGEGTISNVPVPAGPLDDESMDELSPIKKFKRNAFVETFEEENYPASQSMPE